MSDFPELSDEQLARAMPARVRKRLMAGQIESGADIVALRRFIGLTQTQFAQAMTISVHTLRNWEQDRRRPVGPALGLLRIAARHPRIIRENVETAARLACPRFGRIWRRPPEAGAPRCGSFGDSSPVALVALAVERLSSVGE